MTRDDLPSQIEAAVKLENRLTSIEAQQHATHASVDNLIALFGEMKGMIEARFRVLDERDERRAAAQEELKDRLNAHLQEIENRDAWGTLNRLTRKVDDISEALLIEEATVKAKTNVWLGQWRGFVAGAGLLLTLLALYEGIGRLTQG